MEEFTDIKNMWKQLNDRLEAVEEENRRLAREVQCGRYRSAKEKLISKYRKFIFLEIFLICVIVVFIGFNPQVVERYRVVTIIYWIVFCIAEAALDFYLLRNVKKIDIYNSGVETIAHQAARNWKIQKLGVIIAMPAAIGLVVLYGLCLGAEPWVWYGLGIGMIIGLAIGFTQLRQFLLQYRALQG